MKQQVVVIHGADTFPSYGDYIRALSSRTIDLSYYKGHSWKGNLGKVLGDNFEVIAPPMPNKDNAKYEEWRIVFEKVLSLLDDNCIFIGHSMGGIFLAKYFSENDYKENIKAIFLVAAPYRDSELEKLCDFNFGTDCANLSNKANKIFLYHSKDDPVVPYLQVGFYKEMLPNSVVRTFENRLHFNQEDFPELVEDILSL